MSEHSPKGQSTAQHSSIARESSAQQLHTTAWQGAALQQRLQQSQCRRGGNLDSRVSQHNREPQFILPMNLSRDVPQGQGFEAVSFQGI